MLERDLLYYVDSGRLLESIGESAAMYHNYPVYLYFFINLKTRNREMVNIYLTTDATEYEQQTGRRCYASIDELEQNCDIIWRKYEEGFKRSSTCIDVIYNEYERMINESGTNPDLNAINQAMVTRFSNKAFIK